METMDESSNCALLDLYDDLITDEGAKKQEDFQQLEGKYTEALERISSLEKELNQCHSNEIAMKNKTDTLEKNITSLLVTARAELQRKDRELADLRKKMAPSLFKRFNHRPNIRQRTDSPSDTCDSDGMSSELNVLKRNSLINPLDPEYERTIYNRFHESDTERQDYGHNVDSRNRQYSRKRKNSIETKNEICSKKYRYDRVESEEHHVDVDENYYEKRLRDDFSKKPNRRETRMERAGSQIPHTSKQETARRLLEKSKRDLRRKSGEMKLLQKLPINKKVSSSVSDNIESDKENEKNKRNLESEQPESKRRSGQETKELIEQQSSRYSKERSQTPDERMLKIQSPSIKRLKDMEYRVSQEKTHRRSPQKNMDTRYSHKENANSSPRRHDQHEDKYRSSSRDKNARYKRRSASRSRMYGSDDRGRSSRKERSGSRKLDEVGNHSPVQDQDLLQESDDESYIERKLRKIPNKAPKKLRKEETIVCDNYFEDTAYGNKNKEKEIKKRHSYRSTSKSPERHSRSIGDEEMKTDGKLKHLCLSKSPGDNEKIGKYNTDRSKTPTKSRDIPEKSYKNLTKESPQTSDKDFVESKNSTKGNKGSSYQRQTSSSPEIKYSCNNTGKGGRSLKRELNSSDTTDTESENKTERSSKRSSRSPHLRNKRIIDRSRSPVIKTSEKSYKHKRREASASPRRTTKIKSRSRKRSASPIHDNLHGHEKISPKHTETHHKNIERKGCEKKQIEKGESAKHSNSKYDKFKSEDIKITVQMKSNKNVAETREIMFDSKTKETVTKSSPKNKIKEKTENKVADSTLDEWDATNYKNCPDYQDNNELNRESRTSRNSKNYTKDEKFRDIQENVNKDKEERHTLRKSSENSHRKNKKDTDNVDERFNTSYRNGIVSTDSESETSPKLKSHVTSVVTSNTKKNVVDKDSTTKKKLKEGKKGKSTRSPTKRDTKNREPDKIEVKKKDEERKRSGEKSDKSHKREKSKLLDLQKDREALLKEIEMLNDSQNDESDGINNQEYSYDDKNKEAVVTFHYDEHNLLRTGETVRNNETSITSEHHLDDISRPTSLKETNNEQDVPPNTSTKVHKSKKHKKEKEKKTKGKNKKGESNVQKTDDNDYLNVQETLTKEDHTLQKTLTKEDHTLQKTLTKEDHTLQKTLTKEDHTLQKTPRKKVNTVQGHQENNIQSIPKKQQLKAQNELETQHEAQNELETQHEAQNELETQHESQNDLETQHKAQNELETKGNVQSKHKILTKEVQALEGSQEMDMQSIPKSYQHDVHKLNETHDKQTKAMPVMDEQNEHCKRSDRTEVINSTVDKEVIMNDIVTTVITDDNINSRENEMEIESNRETSNHGNQVGITLTENIREECKTDNYISDNIEDHDNNFINKDMNIEDHDNNFINKGMITTEIELQKPCREINSYEENEQKVAENTLPDSKDSENTDLDKLHLNNDNRNCETDSNSNDVPKKHESNDKDDSVSNREKEKENDDEIEEGEITSDSEGETEVFKNKEDKSDTVSKKSYDTITESGNKSVRSQRSFIGYERKRSNSFREKDTLNKEEKMHRKHSSDLKMKTKGKSDKSAPCKDKYSGDDRNTHAQLHTETTSLDRDHGHSKSKKIDKLKQEKQHGVNDKNMIRREKEGKEEKAVKIGKRHNSKDTDKRSSSDSRYRDESRRRHHSGKEYLEKKDLRKGKHDLSDSIRQSEYTNNIRRNDNEEYSKDNIESDKNQRLIKSSESRSVLLENKRSRRDSFDKQSKDYMEPRHSEKATDKEVSSKTYKEKVEHSKNSLSISNSEMPFKEKGQIPSKVTSKDESKTVVDKHKINRQTDNSKYSDSKISTGDTSKSSDSKISTGDTSKCSDTKISTGDTSKSSDSKISTGDNSKSSDSKISKGDNSKCSDSKISRGDTSKCSDTKTSTGDNSKYFDTKISTGDTSKYSDTKTSSGYTSKYSETKTSTGDTSKCSDSKISTGDTSKCSNTKISTGDTSKYSDTKISTGDNSKYSDTKISTGDTSKYSNTKTSTVDKSKYSDTKISTGDTSIYFDTTISTGRNVCITSSTETGKKKETESRKENDNSYNDKSRQRLQSFSEKKSNDDIIMKDHSIDVPVPEIYKSNTGEQLDTNHAKMKTHENQEKQNISAEGKLNSDAIHLHDYKQRNEMPHDDTTFHEKSNVKIYKEQQKLQLDSDDSDIEIDIMNVDSDDDLFTLTNTSDKIQSCARVRGFYNYSKCDIIACSETPSPDFDEETTVQNTSLATNDSIESEQNESVSIIEDSESESSSEQDDNSNVACDNTMKVGKPKQIDRRVVSVTESMKTYKSEDFSLSELKCETNTARKNQMVSSMCTKSKVDESMDNTCSEPLFDLTVGMFKKNSMSDRKRHQSDSKNQQLSQENETDKMETAHAGLQSNETVESSASNYSKPVPSTNEHYPQGLKSGYKIPKLKKDNLFSTEKDKWGKSLQKYFNEKDNKCRRHSGDNAEKVSWTTKDDNRTQDVHTLEKRSIRKDSENLNRYRHNEHKDMENSKNHGPLPEEVRQGRQRQEEEESDRNRKKYTDVTDTQDINVEGRGKRSHNDEPVSRHRRKSRSSDEKGRKSDSNSVKSDIPSFDY